MVNIAVIPGDGIGPEVIGAAIRVLKELQIPLEFVEIAGGFEYFEKHGEPISNESLELCQQCQAILYGANTNPPDRPDYRSLTLTLRRHFGFFANIRPVKSIGEFGRFRNVDVTVFRENSEGLYCGEEHEIADGYSATRKVTRTASERIIRAAFEYARKYSKSRVTVAHKANVLKKTCGLFRQVAFEIAPEYPEIVLEERFIDALAHDLVVDPERFEVIVTTNLFGDIISDLCSGLVGGLGMAPSANIGPQISMFEPVHGSAPDIAGKGVANPTAAILSSALMLAELGFKAEAKTVEAAVKEAILAGERTRDLGGNLSTEEYTECILNRVKNNTAASCYLHNREL